MFHFEKSRPLTVNYSLNLKNIDLNFVFRTGTKFQNSPDFVRHYKNHKRSHNIRQFKYQNIEHSKFQSRSRESTFGTCLRLFNLKTQFRHGESEMNLKKIIGGNGNLSPNGQKYGIALGDYIRSTIDQDNTRFITSTLNRTLQTAKLAQVDIFDKVSSKNFDQISKVVCVIPIVIWSGKRYSTLG